MSWIEKELKRRAAESKAATPDPQHAKPEAESPSKRISHLWAEIQGLNSALPQEIKLAIDLNKAPLSSPEDAGVLEWLRARNGAALGLAGSAIRYVWPERSPKRSKNFWIRWNIERSKYILTQRVSATIPPVVAEYVFNEKRAEHILRCLVQGKRVKIGSIRKRRLWLF